MLNINKINDKLFEFFDQNQDQHSDINMRIQKIMEKRQEDISKIEQLQWRADNIQNQVANLEVENQNLKTNKCS